MSLKNLGRESLIYGFGHVMARFITFLLLPFYTHVFTTEEYGAVSLAYAFIGFALIVYKYGMDTALMKYGVQKLNLDRSRHITVILIIQILTSFAFSFLLYLSKELLAPIALGVDRPEWITYLSIILLLDSIWNLPLIILRTENKATAYILISLLNVTLTMLFNIYFIVNVGYGVEGVFLSNIVSSSLILLVSTKIIYNNMKFEQFDINILKKVLRFGLPFLPAGIFTMIMELSDRYILNIFLGVDDVGLYSAGKKLGMLGLTVVMAFNMGWTPYFLKRGQSQGAKSEFASIGTIFFGGLGYVCMLVILWLPEIIRFSFFGKTLIGEQFWGCESVVNSILIGYFFFGCYLMQLPGIYIKNLTKWVPIFRIIGAFAVVFFSLVLIPRFGINGAAYSIIIAFFLMSLSIYIKLKKVYVIPFDRKSVLFPIAFLLIAQMNFEHLLIRFSLCILFPVLWFFIVLNENQKNKLKEIIK